MSEPRYAERLHVPVLWWLLAGLLALTCGVAIGFYLGLGPGLAVGLAALGVAVLVLGSSMVAITLTPTELRVGRAVLELEYVAGAQALTAAEASRRSGPGADARAYLVLRPFIATAVEVTLDDPADPAPYWLVSSRRPQRLAAAVQQAVAGGLSR